MARGSRHGGSDDFGSTEGRVPERGTHLKAPLAATDLRAVFAVKSDS